MKNIGKMSAPKVLIIQENLKQYRIPIYTIISDYVNLTVGFVSKDKGIEVLPFDYVVLKNYLYGQHFRWIKNLRTICKEYDVVIYAPHLSSINLAILPFWGIKNTSICTWSIGVRASYSRPYSIEGALTISDRIWKWIFLKSDANIFYMDTPIEKWIRLGLPREKFFVAHNTVFVNKHHYDESIKRNVLFVGTLYKEKGVDILIKSFEEALPYLDRCEMCPMLEIVGDGPEKSFLVNYIKEHGLNKYVIFHHAIYDEEALEQLFLRSLICVSPTQAGLTVLKSMGYGVPFVTKEDAITGGCKMNIKNGENGILYKDNSELSEILKEIIKNRRKYIEMGKNAYDYYWTYATPDIMAKGVIDAIDYCIENRNNKK